MWSLVGYTLEDVALRGVALFPFNKLLISHEEVYVLYIVGMDDSEGGGG